MRAGPGKRLTDERQLPPGQSMCPRGPPKPVGQPSEIARLGPASENKRGESKAKGGRGRRRRVESEMNIKF